LFPVGLSTLVAGLGALAVLFGNRFWDPRDPSVPVFFRPLCSGELQGEACHAYGLGVITLAFLGGYIWSVQHILRRLVTVDLPPGSYFAVGLRLVFVTFLALTAAFVLPAAAMGPVAFLIGFFPEQASQYLKGRFDIFRSPVDNQADALPLDMVEGVSFYHKIRFGEIGIDNTQNLACAGLAELLVRTPFRPRLLVDWITQAQLCLAFRDSTAALRTIVDLRNLGDKGLLAEIAREAGVKELWIRSVYELARDDPAVDRLDKPGRILGDG
jgi:hypothetical protein